MSVDCMTITHLPLFPRAFTAPPPTTPFTKTKKMQGKEHGACTFKQPCSERWHNLCLLLLASETVLWSKVLIRICIFWVRQGQGGGCKINQIIPLQVCIRWLFLMKPSSIPLPSTPHQHTQVPPYPLTPNEPPQEGQGLALLAKNTSRWKMETKMTEKTMLFIIDSFACK